MTVPSIATAALARHRERQDAERAENGPMWNPFGLVFCRPSGEQIDASVWRKTEWYPLLARAGLVLTPGLCFHELRHTNGSLMVAGGIDVKKVQQRLGHASARVTLDIYEHVMPDIADGGLDRQSADVVLLRARQLAHLERRPGADAVTDLESHGALPPGSTSQRGAAVARPAGRHLHAGPSRRRWRRQLLGPAVLGGSFGGNTFAVTAAIFAAVAAGRTYTTSQSASRIRQHVIKSSSSRE